MPGKVLHTKRITSPRLRGDLGVCLVWFIFLITVSVQAQESQVIYSGLDNATSIYATTNHLFVVESGKNRVLKLDHNGKLLETLGGLGTGDYQFDEPIDIDATNGLKIYISDYRNNRIQVFDRRFQYLTSIKGDNAFGNGRRIKPTQLVVHDFGELFFYDEASRSIHKHDENGNHVGSFEVPVGMQVSDINLKNDQLELVDTEDGHVQLMSQNGILGEIFPYASTQENLVDFTQSKKAFFFLHQSTIFKQ